METANNIEKRTGILYPLMLIASVTVIVFSMAGIATMLGWLPSAISKNERPARVEPAKNNALPGASRPRAVTGTAATCAECGVIESIRAVEVKGEGSGLGAVTGGVVGGILGNQVGRGGGRTAMTVVGAGAGAYAGHEIEKNVNRSTRYQIHVRMNDGTFRTFYERSQPALSIGQKVRVTEQGIVAAG